MKVAALFSGGKDSTLAAHVAESHGWEVTHLVTVRPRAHDSFMFHVPNLDLTPLIAEAWGKVVVAVETAGEPERELRELTETLRVLAREHHLDGIVSGAVASEYQRTRLERVAHEVGLKAFAPLWHKSPESILDVVTGPGWDVRVAAVAAEGLTERWLGRRLDATAREELAGLGARYGVHLGGEGGEYESLVLDAPFLSARVQVTEARAEVERDRGTWHVTGARLARKEVARERNEGQ